MELETTDLHEEDECVELKDVCGAVLTVRLLSLPSFFFLKRKRPFMLRLSTERLSCDVYA